MFTTMYYVFITHFLYIFICTTWLFLHLSNRYQEAIEKYESVMRTEPNVPFYTSKAKERICFCLVKVCNVLAVCCYARNSTTMVG